MNAILCYKIFFLANKYLKKKNLILSYLLSTFSLWKHELHFQSYFVWTNSFIKFIDEFIKFKNSFINEFIKFINSFIFFRPNASIFLDFGLDWYFMFSLFKFYIEKILYKDCNICLQTSDIIFSCWNLDKLNIKYKSYPKSRKIDAFERKNMPLSQT